MTDGSSEDSSFKSIPPQNARSPLAASTTAATLRSWDNSSKQARSSRIMALLTALTGGRAKCTTATPSFFSSSRVSMSCAPMLFGAPEPFRKPAVTEIHEPGDPELRVEKGEPEQGSVFR